MVYCRARGRFRGKVMVDWLNKVERWIAIRGAIGVVTFALSSAISVVVPSFLAQKLLVFSLGWCGGRIANYFEHRTRTEGDEYGQG